MSTNLRRSTRVQLRLFVTAFGLAEGQTCEGETVTVNLHGALIHTLEPFSVGQKIQIEVFITGKRAEADLECGGFGHLFPGLDTQIRTSASKQTGFDARTQNPRSDCGWL
jgi:hypothetical protein